MPIYLQVALVKGFTVSHPLSCSPPEVGVLGGELVELLLELGGRGGRGRGGGAPSPRPPAPRLLQVRLHGRLLVL